MLGVHQLGENLPGMAARVEVIRVRVGLAFAPLLAAMCGEDVLVVVVVEVLVLVDVRLGHRSRRFDLSGDGACGEESRSVRRDANCARNNTLSWNGLDREDRLDTIRYWSRGARRREFIYGGAFAWIMRARTEVVECRNVVLPC